MAYSIMEWRDKLKPWLAVLNTCGLDVQLSSLPTVSDIDDLWFHVTAPYQTRNNPTQWTLLAEAMELFELLARVDHQTAWFLLFEIARKEHVVQRYGDELLASPDVLPRFKIYVQDDFLLEAGHQTIFGLLRLIVQPSTVSSGYEEVKQAMLRQFSETHSGQTFDRETHGRVKLSLTFDVTLDFANERAIRSVFGQIRQVLHAHKNPSLIRRGMNPDERDAGQPTGRRLEGQVEASPRQRGAFTFESYRISLLSFDNVPDLVLSLIHEVSKVGLPLSHFVVNNVVAAQLRHSVIAGFLINQVVPWAGRRESIGIQNLMLDMGIFDAAAVRAFCSVIVCSHSLREFKFDQSFGGAEDAAFGVEAGSSVWWPWLAYALFSRDATHKIHSVTLSMRGLRSMPVIETVQMVLNANDPSTFLYQAGGLVTGGAEEDGTSPMAVTLNERAKLLLGHHHEYNPTRPNQTPRFIIRESGVTYHVVRDHPEEDFVEFVLPGAGVVWTKRSEVKEMQPRPQRPSHMVRRLTLKDVDQAETSTTIALLELIGEPIEWLSIVDNRGSMVDELLSAALKWCPNVTRLDVRDVSYSGFDWLCGMRENALKLEKLSLTHRSGRTPTDWSPLFGALSDPTHLLSQNLRELSIVADAAPGDTVGTGHGELIRLYVAMLEKNSFHAHHLKFISEVDVPVSIQQKLAFLSVTTLSTEIAEARHQLDVDALGLIFEFAATPKRRRCSMPLRLAHLQRMVGEDGEDEW